MLPVPVIHFISELSDDRTAIIILNLNKQLRRDYFKIYSKRREVLLKFIRHINEEKYMDASLEWKYCLQNNLKKHPSGLAKYCINKTPGLHCGLHDKNRNIYNDNRQC